MQPPGPGYYRMFDLCVQSNSGEFCRDTRRSADLSAVVEVVHLRCSSSLLLIQLLLISCAGGSGSGSSACAGICAEEGRAD